MKSSQVYLRRAYGKVARIIVAKLHIPGSCLARKKLRERYFGLIEGTTEEERLERWGADWRNPISGQKLDER